MPDPAFTSADTAKAIPGLLASLEEAGEGGAMESKLLGGSLEKRQISLEALDRLQKSGLAWKSAKGKGALWFAARHAPTVKGVKSLLLARALPRGPVAWTLGDLTRLLPKVQRDLLPEALKALATEGGVRELHSAKGTNRFWVFPATLPPITPEATHTRQNEAIATAYAAWRSRSGSSLMAISDLQAAAGLSLEALHEWLRQEAAGGRAELSEGDWSLAGSEARSAALILHGQKFIRVRLLEKD